MLEGLSYLNGPKVAWTDLSGLGVIDQTHAVDLRRLRFQPALEKESAFLGGSFDQDGKFLSHKAPILSGRDPGLLLHQLSPPALGGSSEDFRLELKRSRVFLVGVCKDT